MLRRKDIRKAGDATGEEREVIAEVKRWRWGVGGVLSADAQLTCQPCSRLNFWLSTQVFQKIMYLEPILRAVYKICVYVYVQSVQVQVCKQIQSQLITMNG